MSHEIDYSAVEIPDDKPLENYHYTERRADILEIVIRAGSPSRMRQQDLADRYGVDQSTISRDMDAISDHVSEQLGNRAELTARAAFNRVLNDLLDEEDWRAKKAAFDCVMDWSEWLADRGELDRAPRRSEIDMDVRSRSSEVSYRVVREGEDDPLPETDDGSTDYEALGFTSGPAEIDVEAASDSDENAPGEN